MTQRWREMDSNFRFPDRSAARSQLAEALRYIIKRPAALTRFATDARLEADNNVAQERNQWYSNRPVILPVTSNGRQGACSS